MYTARIQAKAAAMLLWQPVLIRQVCLLLTGGKTKGKLYFILCPALNGSASFYNTEEEGDTDESSAPDEITM